MTSCLINLTSSAGDGTHGDFVIQFIPTIQLKGEQFEIALVSANIWYTWFNLSAAVGNVNFRYYNGAVWKTAAFTDGLYSLDRMNSFIKSIISANGDTAANFLLAGDNSTMKALITLNGGYQIDLSVSLLNKVLGFVSQIVTSTKSGENIVDITNSVDNLVIHCSSVDPSYSNDSGRASDIIGSFTPEGDPGSILAYTPRQLIYLPSNQREFSSVHMRVTDQLGRNVILNEPTSFTLHIRRMEM